MQRNWNRYNLSEKQEKKIGRITLSSLKASNELILINTVWCWFNHGYIDQWNRTESRDRAKHIESMAFYKSLQGNWLMEKLIFLINLFDKWYW